MPGVSDTMKFATDQHSMTDSFFALPVKVVMLSGWGCSFGGGLKVSGVRAASEAGAAAHRNGKKNASKKTVGDSMLMMLVG